MAKELKLSFETFENGEYTLTVPHIKENLTDLEVKNAMNRILQSDIIISPTGYLVGLIGASIVEKTTEELGVN